MPVKTKITPALDALLRELAAHGETSGELAGYLAREHGVRVDPRTIRTHLRAARQERAEVTRALVVEKLAPSVTTDLDRLEDSRRKVARRAQRIEHDNDRIREWAALIRLEVTILDLKLFYAGAGEAPQDVRDELAGAAERVRARLGGLTARPGVVAEGRA